MSQEFEIGVIGLGTMGRNLLLNMVDHGFSALGHDKDAGKVQLVKQEAKSGKKIDASTDVKDFLNQLRQPRAVLLLVPAGSAVDAVINELVPFLSPGDLIIDAGNSYFKDTNVREKNLSEKGINFLGVGVSGGELGARHGPSIMPGGNKTAYARVQPILEAIAAKANGEACVTYLGPSSSGHYVKMVHNGIEYALMQLIAETYFLMKNGLKLSNDECHKVYASWNDSELSSYLLEITAQIFLKKEEGSDQRLLDFVLDAAKQNGTGMWTSQDSMTLKIPIPSIDAAVSGRDVSSLKAERKQASSLLKGPGSNPSINKKEFLSQLRDAYYASSIITFTQAMVLLQKASDTYRYELNLESIARIWRGGCIIRAALLEPIMSAYRKSSSLKNLLLDPAMAEEIGKRQADLRAVVQFAAGSGAPMPAMMASLSYYDSYRCARLPTNLIQAQRDFFGAHTYERTDKEGSFHSDWGSA